MYEQVNEPILFKDVKFIAPMVIVKRASKTEILKHLFDDEMIPVAEITDRKNQMFVDMNNIFRQNDTKSIIESVILCIGYYEPFEC